MAIVRLELTSPADWVSSRRTHARECGPFHIMKREGKRERWERGGGGKIQKEQVAVTFFDVFWDLTNVLKYIPMNDQV